MSEEYVWPRSLDPEFFHEAPIGDNKLYHYNFNGNESPKFAFSFIMKCGHEGDLFRVSDKGNIEVFCTPCTHPYTNE